MKYIKLTQGYEAIIDDEDFEKVNQFKWHSAKGGKYAEQKVWNKKTKSYNALFMHRLILNAPKNMDVDHINGNGLDNRRVNLRIATRAQNKFNTVLYKNNTSGFKGVTWRKSVKKWQAQGWLNYKHKWLGLFDTKEEAAKAFKEFAKKYHGEFINLN